MGYVTKLILMLHINFFLLDTCSPRKLEYNEHKFIQSLKTLRPHGLNGVDPFGIPLLNS